MLSKCLANSKHRLWKSFEFKMKKLLIALPLLSSLVTSLIAFSALANPIKQNDDFVQLVGPYMITTEQAQKNVIHLYIPADSVGVISLIDVEGFQGGDKFNNAISNDSYFSLALSKDNKTIFIDNDHSAGKIANIVATTVCGTDMSITVHSISADPNMANTFKPKLSIYSLGCELPNKKEANS